MTKMTTRRSRVLVKISRGTVQEIFHVNFQNKDIIPNHWNSKEKRELNM